jgi:hypothetical protein
MERKAVRVLFILTIAMASLSSLSLVSPDIYSVRNELVLEPSHSWPVAWKVIEEPKWGIRFRVPPDLKERIQGNLWIHENNSLKVIVDFGTDGLGSYLSEVIRRKTMGLKKNYAQKIMTQNGLKYEKPAGVNNDVYSRIIELIYLKNREYPDPLTEPSYRVEYKTEDDQQIAIQILQSVTFFSP